MAERLLSRVLPLSDIKLARNYLRGVSEWERQRVGEEAQ